MSSGPTVADKWNAPQGTGSDDRVVLMSIPPHEIDLLQMTIDEAAELAATGQTEEGYDAINGGLFRAEELARGGDPWGVALARRWLQALDEYCRLYGTPSSQRRR
jgi:hypothetical protein